jgi:general secretion pathway protein C
MKRVLETALALLVTTGRAAAQDVPALPPPEAVGVIVASSPARSVAVLRSSGRTRVVAVGETAFGARVVAVAPGAVTVEWSGAVTELRLTAAGLDSPPLAPPVPSAALAPPPAGSREMSRAELQRRISSEATRLVGETTLVPVWDAGKVAGFTISRVPENSILSESGIEAGDVLTHVNGTPIDSLATLVGLWPRLQSENVVEADLVRNGQPVHLSITLK